MTDTSDFAGPLSNVAQPTPVAVTVSNSVTTIATSAGNLASGSTISPTVGRYVIHYLTGTTTVNTITAGTTGDVLQLIASGQSTGVCVVIAHGAGNIKIRGGANLGLYAQVPADTAASVGESLTFLFDGTNWVEIDRDLRTVLDYVQITSNVSITATTEGTANTAITGTALTSDGATPLDYELFVYGALKGTTYVVVCLFEDGSTLGLLGQSGATTSSPLVMRRRRIPAAGSHTPSIRAFVDAGTGTISAGAWGAGTPPPAYLKVSRSV